MTTETPERHVERTSALSTEETRSLCTMERREFLRRSIRAGVGVAGVGVAGSAASGWLGPRALVGQEKRRMTIDLVPGMIGVRASLDEIVELAARHGFESVAPSSRALAGKSDDELKSLLADLKKKKLIWGAAGLPVNFWTNEEEFRKGMGALPDNAAILQRAGVTRVGTWLNPSHGRFTYLENFKLHQRRLSAIARVLGDHGLRFGLEYIGTKSLWTRSLYPFVHTLKEARELIAAIDVKGVGVVLDSWHWYCARETADDLMVLRNEDIVAVDLNDAPAGVPVEEQRDNRRELPATTGVIDTASFLTALNKIGYDGPVRSEPFNQALNELGNAAAVAATATAMKKAFAQMR